MEVSREKSSSDGWDGDIEDEEAMRINNVMVKPLKILIYLLFLI